MRYIQVILVVALAAPGLARSVPGAVPHVVGGRPVSVPGTYPWQAIIQFVGMGRENYCAGVVIDLRYVATAHHCANRPLAEITVGLGYHNLDDLTVGNPTDYEAINIIHHPNYVSNGEIGFPFDISLVRLAQNVDVSSPYIGIISLAPADSGGGNPNYAGRAAVFIGWGVIDGDVLPGVLHEAAGVVLTEDECRYGVGPLGGLGAERIRREHICMGDKLIDPPQMATCNGDSGGPLMYYDDPTSKWILIGLTSWGTAGCRPDYPTVYVRISNVRQWIDIVIS